tara:strand:- start:17886 stop:18539 length:654 start_codon:yes stop_codon:yes gene_type:complete
MDAFLQELSIKGMDYNVEVYSVLVSLILGLLTYIVAGLTFNRSMLSSMNLLVAAMLPAIALTITGSIASNFSLSLGMIGALSIVRYRTPIKSPYELTLLFLLVTIGVVSGVNPANAIQLFIAFTLVSILLKIIISRFNVEPTNITNSFILTLIANKKMSEIHGTDTFQDRLISTNVTTDADGTPKTTLIYSFESLISALEANTAMQQEKVSLSIEQD